MAANFGDLKDYDHQFVEPPPDDLLCLICLCVARDPQQITCCGKVLCKGCLEKHKKNSTVCPQCRKDINSFADKRSKLHHADSERYKLRCIGKGVCLDHWYQLVMYNTIIIHAKIKKKSSTKNSYHR
jgi:predicted amidophosphoribosyltransferase